MCADRSRRSGGRRQGRARRSSSRSPHPSRTAVARLRNCLPRGGLEQFGRQRVGVADGRTVYGGASAWLLISTAVPTLRIPPTPVSRWPLIAIASAPGLPTAPLTSAARSESRTSSDRGSDPGRLSNRIRTPSPTHRRRSRSGAQRGTGSSRRRASRAQVGERAVRLDALAARRAAAPRCVRLQGGSADLDPADESAPGSRPRRRRCEWSARRRWPPAGRTRPTTTTTARSGPRRGVVRLRRRRAAASW